MNETTLDAAAVVEEAAQTPFADATTDQINGRSAFCVEVTSAGLAVHTVFAADDGRTLAMPAVFPDLHYALEQIDALRRLVTDRFAQAALVGAQVIANQRAKAAAAAITPATAPAAAQDGAPVAAQD